MPSARQDMATDQVFEAMVLACIDPRMQKHVRRYLVEEEKLDGKYSQVTFAGAAVGAIAPRFEGWHQTFWDHLAITLALHKITRVLVIDHRDCGAAREAYGPQPSQDSETQLHRRVMEDLRGRIHERYPELTVEILLMDLEGNIEKFPHRSDPRD